MDAVIPDLFVAAPERVGNGRYVLQERIGMGGVAEVFRAIDTQNDALCAVKLLEIPYGPRRAVALRFLAEARAMGSLRHPHIPRVYQWGREGSYAWFAMELADASVAQRVRRDGPYDSFRALRIAFEVLQALAVAHRAGLIHRDVKPDNVLVARDGRTLLADFGIARHPEGTVPVQTRPGELFGTRGYRAPEQEDDATRVRHTADLYGVAAMLYMLCVGRSPRRLWDRSQDLPASLEPEVAAIIATATAWDATARYADARAMAEAVARAADRCAGRPGVASDWMREFEHNLRRIPTGWMRFLPDWAVRWIAG